MGFLDKFVSKKECSVCNKLCTEFLMYPIYDGKICSNCLEKVGIKCAQTKVGDRFVLEEMNLCGYALGGEQSGHIIFREYATTGDGQLTAVQLLSIMVKEETSLSELASVMQKAPQTMINLTVSANGKRLFYTDAAIKKAIDDAAYELGTTGRIVVRPSGTEPLIRVMAEGSDIKTIERIANSVANTIKERLGNK